jgi:hypothetical protein
MAAACRWPSPSKAPMCLTRNWLPPHSTPSRSSAPIPPPKSRSIFASIKAMPANRLTAKPANAAIRRTFRARPTKSQSRSIVGNLGGGKLNALIPGSTVPGGCSSAGKKRWPITWASCIFSSPSSLYEPRRFSDRLLGTYKREVECGGASGNQQVLIIGTDYQDVTPPPGGKVEAVAREEGRGRP